MRINTRSVFLGSKYAVQQFLKQELRANSMRGWIVNLASMVSNIGMQGLSKLSPEHDQSLSDTRLTQYSWVHSIQGCRFRYD